MTDKMVCLQTTPKDLENLLRAIDWRIQQLKLQGDWEKMPDPVGLTHGEKRKADDAESPPTTHFKHK